jgi:hypothetical protein
MGLPFNKMDFK